jgi:DNA-binding transcriptional ArsR family regulator
VGSIGSELVLTGVDQPGGYSSDANRIFFALSDVTRRRLLERLLANDDQRQAALTAGLDLSRQAAVKHLKVLEQAGLVTVDRVGCAVVYRLNRAPLSAVTSKWLDRYIQARYS